MGSKASRSKIADACSFASVIASSPEESETIHLHDKTQAVAPLLSELLDRTVEAVIQIGNDNVALSRATMPQVVFGKQLRSV